ASFRTQVCWGFFLDLLTSSLVFCTPLWAIQEEVGVKDETSRELSVGELLERANRDRSPGVDEPPLAEGDIAVRTDNKNADPCTSRGCLWNKWTDGKVYIPYYIANHYSSRERDIIVRGLESFSGVSCIRFRPYQNGDYEWLSIESGDGCWSYVGRQGGSQTVSLSRQGCLYHGTVQHELLHALASTTNRRAPTGTVTSGGLGQHHSRHEVQLQQDCHSEPGDFLRLRLCDAVPQVRLLQKRPPDHGAHPQQQRFLWRGHPDEQERHRPPEQAVQVLKPVGPGTRLQNLLLFSKARQVPDVVQSHLPSLPVLHEQNRCRQE
uniref:Peptidase M12A domain-containing protein n=1 Tax=Takifugu rubripes TaxID=31033 RepID=A0A674PC16_TAKRU